MSENIKQNNDDIIVELQKKNDELNETLAALVEQRAFLMQNILDLQFQTILEKRKSSKAGL